MDPTCVLEALIERRSTYAWLGRDELEGTLQLITE